MALARRYPIVYTACPVLFERVSYFHPGYFKSVQLIVIYSRVSKILNSRPYFILLILFFFSSKEKKDILIYIFNFYSMD